MDMMNELLAMVENPTRRRIIEALTREPHYPFQLAKELGISQPAVVKHLDLMERNGLVTAHQEDSRSGPKRNVYTTNSEFTIVVDVRSGMFTARLVTPEERTECGEMIDGLKETRENISEIDGKIAELDRMRSSMIRKRESLISSMMSAVSGGCGYGHRSLLYRLLNEPDRDPEDLSADVNMNMNLVKGMLEDIERIIEQRRK
jgi:predicted transcriptional regulator